MFITPSHAQDTVLDPDAPAAADPLNTETGIADQGDVAGGVFPPFDSSTFASQILWLAITFGLFYLFMQKVIVPRIGGILENRRDRIAQDIDEASRLQSDADEAMAAYEQELAEARARATQIAQAARDNAKSEADIERTQIESDLAARMADAEARITDIKTRALSDVDTIAEDTTLVIVEHLVGGTVDRATVASAVKSASAPAN